LSGLAVGAGNNKNSTAGVAYQVSHNFIPGYDDVFLNEVVEKTGIKNTFVRIDDLINVNNISKFITTHLEILF